MGSRSTRTNTMVQIPLRIPTRDERSELRRGKGWEQKGKSNEEGNDCRAYARSTEANQRDELGKRKKKGESVAGSINRGP